MVGVQRAGAHAPFLDEVSRGQRREESLPSRERPFRPGLAVPGEASHQHVPVGVPHGGDGKQSRSPGRGIGLVAGCAGRPEKGRGGGRARASRPTGRSEWGLGNGGDVRARRVICETRGAGSRCSGDTGWWRRMTGRENPSPEPARPRQAWAGPRALGEAQECIGPSPVYPL
ncbi:hypothetical protein ZWY2020_024367 [Hordeum vulgare]|nr:hypothetical protein ZWY2020_024367 [Hordeum vulgare]